VVVHVVGTVPAVSVVNGGGVDVFSVAHNYTNKVMSSITSSSINLYNIRGEFLLCRCICYVGFLHSAIIIYYLDHFFCDNWLVHLYVHVL